MSRLERWGLTSLFAVYLLVGVPVLLNQLDGGDLTVGPNWLWWLAYVGYLVILLATFVLNEHSWAKPLPLVGALSATAMAVVFLAPSAGWTAILLVFTTAAAAHVVSVRATMALLVLHSVAVLASAMLVGAQFGEAALGGMIYAMLQGCSVWAVYNELRANAASERLAVTNTELRAATALLAESSRSTERLRIARELHDVVGHQLTALALELEVAAHKSTPPASEHVQRARGLAKDLLTDVRTAVGELRERPPDLREALASIAADLPRPKVHLSIAETVSPDEDRVATLIRCVQEIVTNTIRHSDARNLWIEIDGSAAGELKLSARDDGQGAVLLRLGNGLTGLTERIEALHGTVGFDTRSGFQLNAEVPAP
ncbi:signal transduction histidine kinase [Tamaricihabitans halophyticus]|uniref:Signal transduction histidine kinase n=1 Tax=Tamaricihabitans halophyticus TaxID=1262583 RepID=A0A4V2SV91_9PSEU|nr:histidine kinase [Tamaricihabitans halophyticus]TCP57106.1 signal transduction histidine kinase [Tamaricihabitans halophyticus]